jgi:hypothetical protein
MCITPSWRWLVARNRRGDGVEGGLAVLAGDDRVGDVQGQGGEAGEDQQPAGGLELLRCCAVQREVSGTQQQSEDRQVDRGGD